MRGTGSTRRVVAGGALGVVVTAVVGLVTHAPAVGVVPGTLVAALPAFVAAHRRAERRRAVVDAWPDALREVLVHVRAGRSLPQALGALGVTGPAPLRPVFADFVDRARSTGVAAALEAVRDRLADPTGDRVVEVLLVAVERGGPAVVPVLDDLLSAAVADRRLAEEVDTAALEQRINGRAVLVLPWLVLIALTVRPGPFRAFYGTPAGIGVLALAALLGGVGAAWLARLGRPVAEPRVFAGRAEAVPAPVGSAVAVGARRRAAVVAIGAVVGLGLGRSPQGAAIGAAVAAAVVLTRGPARRARLADEHRTRLRLELVGVDLVLALLVRAGAGPVQAVTRVVRRGHGVVVDELAAVLASIRAGRSEAEAFRHAADTTPEPHAARTYRCFALAAEHGADLGPTLLALAADLQEARREEVRRTATRRRAAMLLPTIGVLAPVMLLFVVAPLPSVVLGGR